MGATIPLAMLAIRSDARYEARRSFSFLYLANVVGAVAGALVPLYLIETFGFRSTLHIGALLNASIALGAVLLTFVVRPETAVAADQRADCGSVQRKRPRRRLPRRRSKMRFLCCCSPPAWQRWAWK